MFHHDQLLIILSLIVGLWIVSLVLEKFDLLSESYRRGGGSIRFWPVAVLLAALSAALAWPEAQDAYDTGHLVYATTKIEMLQDDGIHDLLTSTFSDQCKLDQAQWKFNESQAEALDEVGDQKEAEQLRAAQRLGPQCVAPSTPDP